MRRKLIGSIALILASMTVAASEAPACEYDDNPPFEIDPAEALEDTTPPSVAATVGPVYRGHGTRQVGACSWAGDSCMDSGSFAVEVASTDDRTAPESMGYMVRLVDGHAPEFFGNALDVPIRSSRMGGGSLVFVWDDGATDDQEPLDFTLEITPIDLAGNEGEPVRVEVHDPGSGGCGAGSPLAGHLLLALSSVAIAIVLRRRRGA